MPPAFVLSQDQTLMFILYRSTPAIDPKATAKAPLSLGPPFTQKSPPRMPQSTRSRPLTRANSYPIAAARASLPIPTMSINKPARRRHGQHHRERQPRPEVRRKRSLHPPGAAKG